MTLPDFLEDIPKSIIKKVKPEHANLHRIIPYGGRSKPNGVIVAVGNNLSDIERRSLEGAYRLATGEIIFMGEGISEDDMNEALERYYS
jgi:hypothetical protein